ncbi:MAG TPA: glutamine--fructose-6-phosphate transaminase (isomerizing) [Clostridia bacterium]
MCGIIGYVGNNDCVNILLDGLKQLEYRGYDSAGIAVINNQNKIEIIKKVGSPEKLIEEVSKTNLKGCCGIGHTRWATHGKPSDINSHPHKSGIIALIHNGIIENFAELKNVLLTMGVKFVSETDTEVIAHLINNNYKGNMLQTLKQVTALLKGSYSLAILCEKEPDKIYAVKKDSPIVIGKGKDANYVASDITALIKHTDQVYILKDYEYACLSKDDIKFYDKDLQEISKTPQTIDFSLNSLRPEENGSYMLKEMREIPDAVRKTLQFYLDKDIDAELSPIVKDIDNITIVACGTAYHAGLVGKYLIEELARIPVNIDIASEFRYKKPIISNKTLTIAISQSGETADTLAALKYARKLGSKSIAVTNVRTSSITQNVDYVMPTIAGPEIGVAATKSYNTQLIVMFILALSLLRIKRAIKTEEYEELLRVLPAKCDIIKNEYEDIEKLALKFSNANRVFFLGRGLDYAVALEGALKLKEISYISSEGLAAGELKHGTLALIEQDTLVIVLLTQKELINKTMNALYEVKARGAQVIAITQDETIVQNEFVDYVIHIPSANDYFMPVLGVMPLQYFSYYMAVNKGYNPDKPRNLAKSVTVE